MGQPSFSFSEPITEPDMQASIAALPTEDDLPCDDGGPMETPRHRDHMFPTLAPAAIYRAQCHPWGVPVLGCLMLVYGLLAAGGCRPTMVGPTQPSGYHVTLPETSQTLRLQPLTLTVHVTDASGSPLDDVPVHFRIPPDWTTVAQISPPTVTTRQGRASATFRARAAGDIVVEVTVEDLTQAIRIAILGDTPRF
jgi:Big-like domain-containing protein